METTIVMTHTGLVSLLPGLIAVTLAILSKRVIESLLAAILISVLIHDAHLSGLLHSLIYAVPNLVGAITGHPADVVKGLKGVGLINGTGRIEVLLTVLLLGSFITVMEKSGGAFAFGERISQKIRNQKDAQTSAALMGTALFTSAYFSALATGTVFRPIFDKLKISRAKLAFILDATAAPTHVLIPISGWVAYMAQLIKDNIPGLDDGMLGLFRTIPFNFYCLLMIAFVFLNVRGLIPDFASMGREQKAAEAGFGNRSAGKGLSGDHHAKNGTSSDMALPLGVSVATLFILGTWNYTLANYGFAKLPLSGTMMLILGFVAGLLVAFAKYVSKGLMTAKEFLDLAIEGSKSAILGGMIITLAVTLGDLMRAPYPEGLGAAQYLTEIAVNLIPPQIIPFATFVIASFISFAMGTSWGVWAILMPISLPLTLAVGGDPYLTAAAVLSGGTVGDHCSPISDTTIMSSIASECEHIVHVNTQLPYAILVAAISAVCFLVAGFIF